ncbi:MAG: alkaline phosphatase D family protein [Myxococcales bacterium]|nr:alkaline phosphatase D family protein [Myxococcales bacterium]
MTQRRREFLELTCALGLTACAPTRASTPRPQPRPPAPGDATPFRHGVASGDPLADRVILWTRVTPLHGLRPVTLDWVVAEDEGLGRPVVRGTARAEPARDFTVKVDAQGLRPGATYFYRFTLGGHASPIGRTRTLPAADVERVRLAFTSCSNYPYGYFNVYAAMAQRDDLDAVLHLGDYIYEYGDGTYGDGAALGRVPEPDREILTREEYRQRYALYRRDPDLQELHRRHPFISVWDDHEFANNAHLRGAENHQPASEGVWAQRARIAHEVYREWMPIREQDDPIVRIYRAFRYGRLAELIMLDTRYVGRDPQAPRGERAALADPRRSLLGAAQERWLSSTLTRSRGDGVGWRLLGQQVMFAQLRGEDQLPRNTDMWDGYDPARQRVLEQLRGERIDNVVVLTGDIHSSWANELARDPFAASAATRAPLAVELVTPAVSSPPPVKAEEADERARWYTRTHPHLRWVEFHHRGYVLLDVTAARARAEWHFVPTVSRRTSETSLARVFEIASGEARLHG